MSKVMEIRKKIMDLDDQANELWYALKAGWIKSEEFAAKVRPMNDKRWDLLEELAALTGSGARPFGD